MPLLPYRSYVLISREQLVRNYRSVRAAAGPEVAVMAVVKANAYGHGAVEVARVLVSEGVEWLAVSSVTEGVTLRRAGIETPILVMTGVLPHGMERARGFAPDSRGTLARRPARARRMARAVG